MRYHAIDPGMQCPFCGRPTTRKANVVEIRQEEPAA